MKKGLLLSLVASTMIFAGGDVAPVAPAFSWEGSYAGVLGGVVSGTVDVIDEDGYNGPLPAGNFSYDPDNGAVLALFGGQNWQNGSFVFGMEGELGYMNLNGSQQFPPYVGVRGPNDSVASIDSDFYASLTGRVGLAFDKVLFYLKGGVTGLNTEVSFIDTDPAGTTLVSGTSKSEFMVAPTIGGGFELAIDSDTFIRVEYMYTDFDTISHTATTAGGFPVTFTHDIKDVHAFKAGVSYRF